MHTAPGEIPVAGAPFPGFGPSDEGEAEHALMLPPLVLPFWHERTAIQPRTVEHGTLEHRDEAGDGSEETGDLPASDT